MSLQGLLEGFGGNLSNQIFTTTIGEIVEMDREYNRAKKVLVKKEEKLKIEEDIYLYNVPILSHQNKDFVTLFPYKKGDKAQILFSHRDLSNILANDGSDPRVEKFKMEYAFIIGAPILFDDSISPVKNVEDDDFALIKRDGTAKVVLKSNGDVQIDTSGKVILGDEDSVEGIALGDKIKEYLDNHTHNYTWSDDGGSGTTSPPSTKSPEPSKKVFVE